MAQWIDLALQHHAKVTLLPFEPQTAVLAARLKDFHGDPADRFLVAIAFQKKILVIYDKIIS